MVTEQYLPFLYLIAAIVSITQIVPTSVRKTSAVTAPKVMIIVLPIIIILLLYSYSTENHLYSHILYSILMVESCPQISLGCGFHWPARHSVVNSGSIS